MCYVTTKDGTKLFVKDWGNGRPVILIHGWPLTADSWDVHAVAIAAAGYRVITYDRRGFGRSDQPWTGYEYDTLADDLADIIREKEVRNASNIGFSMGGGEVVRYMSRHQGKGVVQTGLISSIVPYMLQTKDNPNGVPKSVFDHIAASLIQDRPGFYGSFINEFYGVGWMSQPVSSECLEWTRMMAMQASLKATLDCAVAFATTDFRSELSSVTTPTLVVHGTSDKTVPIDATGRAAAKAIPKATLKEYESAPHGLTVTHQRQLTEDLLDFLR